MYFYKNVRKIAILLGIIILGLAVLLVFTQVNRKSNINVKKSNALSIYTSESIGLLINNIANILFETPSEMINDFSYVKEKYPYGIHQFTDEFYKNISDKKYESAYEVAPLGRTYAEFVDDYKGIAKVYATSPETSVNGHRLEVTLVHTSGERSFYDVILQIQEKRDSYEITSATANPIKKLYSIEYTQLENETGSDYHVFDASSGKEIPFEDTSFFSGRIQPGLITGDSQFIIVQGGAAARSTMAIYEYNRATSSLYRINELHFWQNRYDYAAGMSIPDCNLQLYPISELESYSSDCYLQYKDEEWYIENFRTLQLMPNYHNDYFKS